jgi:hypothetical protein
VSAFPVIARSPRDEAIQLPFAERKLDCFACARNDDFIS